MFGHADGLQPLFSFLQSLQSKGKPLMINKRLENCQQLEDSLSLAVEYLSSTSGKVCLDLKGKEPNSDYIEGVPRT